MKRLRSPALAAPGASARQADQRWQRAQRAGRRWALWGAALGVLLGGVVAAPAQWLAGALGDLTGGRLLLAQARGSLWSGSALVVLTGGPGSRDAATLPDRLHWELRPTWRGLRLQLSQACCLVGQVPLLWQPAWAGYTLSLAGPAGSDTGPAASAAPAASPSAAPTPGGAQIGHWPAAWLAGLGTPWNTLQLGGSLHLSSSGIALQSVRGRMLLDGALTLDLRDIASRLSPLPALGSYRVGVQGRDSAGQAAQMSLRTLDGALQINGSGQFTGTGLRFRGQAQAAPGQEAALANLLNIIGRRQGALSVISIG